MIRRFVLLLVSGVALAATPEANKTAARRFYEDVWFGHKVDVVDELFAPEYLNHDPRDPDEKARSEGRKAPRATQKELARQQSGSTGRIDFQIAEGDRVMTRWVWTMPLAGGWERFVAGKDHIEIPVVQRFGSMRMAVSRRCGITATTGASTIRCASRASTTSKAYSSAS